MMRRSTANHRLSIPGGSGHSALCGGSDASLSTANMISKQRLGGWDFRTLGEKRDPPSCGIWRSSWLAKGGAKHLREIHENVFRSLGGLVGKEKPSLGSNLTKRSTSVWRGVLGGTPRNPGGVGEPGPRRRVWEWPTHVAGNPSEGEFIFICLLVSHVYY